jgi:hypothetical protein
MIVVDWWVLESMKVWFSHVGGILYMCELSSRVCLLGYVTLVLDIRSVLRYYNDADSSED